MADPRLYGAVFVAFLTYLMFGPSSVKTEKFVPPADEKPASTIEERTMNVMRFAMESDQPLYRMSPKEIQHRIRSQK